MSQILGNKLPERAMRYLQVGRVVVVTTIDEDGFPNAAPVSWLLATDNNTVRMAVSRDIATYHNLLRNNRLMLSIIGGGMTLGIKGCARVIADTIPDLPFPMAMFEVEVREVKDDSVLGRADEGPVLRWEERRRTVSDHKVLVALQAGGNGASGGDAYIAADPNGWASTESEIS